jgi:hypothetical protein
MSRWFLRRSKKVKAAVIVLATFMVFAGIGAVTASSQRDTAVKGDSTVQRAIPLGNDESEKAPLDANRTEIETTQEEVPFPTATTYDGSLAKDTTIVRVEGMNGKKVVKTEIKYKNGVEVSRSLINETITVPAVTKVVAIGTKIVAKSSKPKPVEPAECSTATAETATDSPENCVPDHTDENQDNQ